MSGTIECLPEPGDGAGGDNAIGPHDDIVVVDGEAPCPVCGKSIKVGMGGKQNLLKQHKPGASKACQRNLEKKRKADSRQRSRASQPGIQSFFTKQPKVLPSPDIPPPIPVISHAMKSTSESHTMGTAPRTAPLVPETHAANMLAALEKTVGNLPNFVPPIVTVAPPIAAPPITVPEPSDSEVIFLDSEPTRVGCGRRCGDMSGLSLCLCGERAQPDNVGSIQCERTGCETVWYHLRCVGYADAAPKHWTCESCSTTKKIRRRWSP